MSESEASERICVDLNEVSEKKIKKKDKKFRKKNSKEKKKEPGILSGILLVTNKCDNLMIKKMKKL